MKQQTETGILEAAVGDLKNLTPDQIAEKMRKHEIGGRPGTTGNCPLARLLHGTWGGEFIVGPKFVVRRCGRRLEKIPTPESLKQFLRAFDLSRYPDLIMPPPRVLPKKPKTKTGKRRTYKRGPVVNRPSVLVGRWQS